VAFADELSVACADYARRYNYSPNELGRGFEAFVVHLSAADGSFLTDADTVADPMNSDLSDNIFRTNEGGVDGYLEDDTNKIVMLIQAKYGKGRMDEEELNSFLNIPNTLMSPERDDYLSHLDPRVRAVLAPLNERMKDKWGIVLRFATNRPPSDRETQLVKAADAQFKDRGLRISCEIVGQENLKAIWHEVVSGAAAIQAPVDINFRKNHYLEFSTPRPTIVGVLSGNELANLWKRYHNLLFAQNIRFPMLSTGRVNPEIRKTAKDKPTDFFYFNNGVSALCTRFEEKDGQIKAWDFQIINGAQTVGNLGDLTTLSSEVKVLFRLTTTEANATTFRDDIIRTNNTQNEVVPWDFRANDPIQKWLEKALESYSGNGPVPFFWYKRKRGLDAAGRGGRALDPEYFGKLRHSFIHGPVPSYKEPKRLASTDEDTGLYPEAFGLGGEVVNLWPKPALDEAVFAYALDSYVLRKAEEYKQRNHAYGRWLKRLSRYVVAAIAEIARSEPSLKLDAKTFVTLPLDEFGRRVDEPLKGVMSRVNQRYEELKPDRVQPEYDIGRDQETFNLICKTVVAELTA
jgi:hypothetical protein